MPDREGCCSPGRHVFRRAGRMARRGSTYTFHGQTARIVQYDHDGLWDAFLIGDDSREQIAECQDAQCFGRYRESSGYNIF